MKRIDHITRWRGRQTDNGRNCHAHKTEVTKDAERVEGCRADSVEHADDTRCERAR